MVCGFVHLVSHRKDSDVPVWWSARCNAVNSLKELYSAVNGFEKSLYHQKHAFYFRKVKQWSVSLLVSTILEHKRVSSLTYSMQLVGWLTTYRR